MNRKKWWLISDWKCFFLQTCTLGVWFNIPFDYHVISHIWCFLTDEILTEGGHICFWFWRALSIWFTISCTPLKISFHSICKRFVCHVQQNDSEYWSQRTALNPLPCIFAMFLVTEMQYAPLAWELSMTNRPAMSIVPHGNEVNYPLVFRSW